MLVKDLQIGDLVNIEHDPFFNAIGDDGGPKVREVERVRRTTGEFRYVSYIPGERIVTYPDDYEVVDVDA